MSALSGPNRPGGRRCPICGKPTEQHYRPFCSKRCADIDLGRWLGETYRVPGPPAPVSDDDEPES